MSEYKHGQKIESFREALIALAKGEKLKDESGDYWEIDAAEYLTINGRRQKTDSVWEFLKDEDIYYIVSPERLPSQKVRNAIHSFQVKYDAGVLDIWGVLLPPMFFEEFITEIYSDLTSAPKPDMIYMGKRVLRSPECNEIKVLVNL